MKRLLQTTGLIFAMLLLANVVMAQDYTFSPENNAKGVSTSPTLTITFDDVVTLEDGKYIYIDHISDPALGFTFATGTSTRPITPRDGRLEVEGNTLNIYLSNDNLIENTQYSVYTDQGAIKVGGNAFDDLFEPTFANSVWSFTTIDALVPVSYSFSPIDNSTGVSTSPTLIIEFDDVVTLSEGKYIYLDHISDPTLGFTFATGTTTRPITPRDNRLEITGNTLTIYLTNNILIENTQYSVFADVGAIKVGGLFWDDLYDPNYSTSIWSFTTGETPVDPEAPNIVSVTPPKGTTDVSVTPQLTVEFDRVIEFGTGGSFRIKSDVNEMSYSIPTENSNSSIVSISGNTLTINAGGLNINTTYHVEIDPDFIENYVGLSEPTEWTFTTESAPPKWAEDYPTITQSRTDFTFTGKTDLGGIYYFVVTGNMASPTVKQITEGKNRSGSNAFKKFNEQVGGNIDFTKSMDFTPQLLPGITYYLHTVVKSDDGKYSHVETLPIDRTPPTINDVLSHPIDGYELFPVDDSILIVFSEKVNNYNEGIAELTLASFDLKTDGQSVPFSFSISEDGTEVTLTPQEPLSGNTKYEVEIAPLSDDYYNVMSSSVTRTFYTDQLNVWNGNSSSLWGDAGNWQEPYITGKSVLIPDSLTHYPVIDSDITVNNFTIEAGAVLTQTDGAIKVLGDFDLLSSEATNASYLPKEGTLTVAGETRVHQYIVPALGTSVVYVMGTPTFGSTKENVGSGYKIKKYDNRTDSWPFINDTELMEPGVGYSIYAENNLIFRGKINREATTHELYRTTGKGYGWNVMGNPFTAGMKWGELGIDTATIENSYWIWNPQNKIYGAFNQEAGVGVGNLDGTIPSNHGFLVKLKIGEISGSITFDPKAMVANDNNYLKSASKSKPHIKISAGDGNFTDQLAIAFVSDAAQGIDKYDTEKYFSSGNTLQIFSVEATSKLSINSLPGNNKETTVGLGYRATKAGTYTIELSDNYLDHYEVILTDSKGGKEIDLLYDGSYTFTVDKPETNNTRFTLTFPAMVSTSIEKGTSKIDLKIYSQEGDIIAELVSGAKSMTYELVSVSGQVLKRGDLYSGVNNLGKQPSGLFIINTKNSEGTIISKKLLVTR